MYLSNNRGEPTTHRQTRATHTTQTERSRTVPQTSHQRGTPARERRQAKAQTPARASHSHSRRAPEDGARRGETNGRNSDLRANQPNPFQTRANSVIETAGLATTAPSRAGGHLEDGRRDQRVGRGRRVPKGSAPRVPDQLEPRESDTSVRKSGSKADAASNIGHDVRFGFTHTARSELPPFALRSRLADMTYEFADLPRSTTGGAAEDEAADRWIPCQDVDSSGHAFRTYRALTTVELVRTAVERLCSMMILRWNIFGSMLQRPTFSACHSHSRPVSGGAELNAFNVIYVVPAVNVKSGIGTAPGRLRLLPCSSMVACTITSIGTACPKIPLGWVQPLRPDAKASSKRTCSM